MGRAKKIEWPILDIDLAFEWGLINVDVKGEHRSVLHVGSESGDFALKCVDYPVDTLHNLQEIMQFVKARGFTNCSQIVPTITGKSFVTGNNGRYILTQWISGRESNFLKWDNLITCACTLGKLHACTKGIRPKGKNWRKRWTRSLSKLKRLNLGYNPDLSRLSSLLPELINSGEQALALLENPEVAASMEQSAVVCHYDLSNRNFVINPNSSAYLIDFDNSRADVPMLDLAQFLDRVLKPNNWNQAIAVLTLLTYAQSNHLSKGDLGAILAFLLFPRTLWGLPRSSVLKNQDSKAIFLRTKKIEACLKRQAAIIELQKALGL